jgi:hypothetical protein
MRLYELGVHSAASNRMPSYGGLNRQGIFN